MLIEIATFEAASTVVPRSMSAFLMKGEPNTPAMKSHVGSKGIFLSISAHCEPQFEALGAEFQMEHGRVVEDGRWPPIDAAQG